MNHTMKHVMFIFVSSCLTMPFLAFSQDANEANEPTIKGPGAIYLKEAHWMLGKYRRPTGM